MSIAREIETAIFGMLEPVSTALARITGRAVGGGPDHGVQALIVVSALVYAVGLAAVIRRRRRHDDHAGGRETSNAFVIGAVAISLLVAGVGSTAIGVPLSDERGTLGSTGEVGHVAEEAGGAIVADLATEAVGGLTSDSDGDRLLDGWERAGRTPTGAPLPGADPLRKDLYLQIHYAEGIRPLTDDERTDLVRIWAEMPVENPDGSRGITLHVLDGPERGGRLDHPVVVSDPGMKRIHGHYTQEYMDGAGCVYYQTVMGEIDDRTLLGRASVPGYSSMVDGRRDAMTDRGITVRTSVVTHELLHNVAGRVDGSVHTETGLLAPSHRNRNVSLSAATARDLLENGFARSDYYEWQVCGVDYRRMLPAA